MRMCFLHRGTFSGINRSMIESWRQTMPSVEVMEHDLAGDLQWGFLPTLRGLPVALHHASPFSLARGGGRFNEVIMRTAWFMEQSIRAVRRVLDNCAGDFVLSTGTVIPVLENERPHFVYTDMTILANFYYPGGQQRAELWKECIPYEREWLCRAAMVFTMSDHITRSLTEQYGLPTNRVMRVNCGCNVPPVTRPASTRYNRKNILFVGVDWERKGGPEVVEAFRIVRKRHPEASLTVVGCEPRLAEPGIEVLGRLPPKQVADCLCQASLFCMPSRREPFGIVYLEAMRAGLPVIACRLGATPDFVLEGETGHLVEPGDIDGLAGRIEALLSDAGKCRRMGERGRDLVEREYTWAKTCSRMWQAIESRLRSSASSLTERCGAVRWTGSVETRCSVG